MGIIGWKLLSDNVVLDGTVDHTAINSDDGDWSLFVKPGYSSTGLLSHDDVTNTNGLIECEVNPTMGAYTLNTWFAQVPNGAPVVVSGAWVSDCSHTHDGHDAVVHGIFDELLSAGHLLPDLGILNPIEFENTEAACNNGKTEIHPIAYVLAQLPSSNLSGELISLVFRYLLIVLTESTGEEPIHRPILPPQAGDGRSVDISLAYPLNAQISSFLAHGTVPWFKVTGIAEAAAKSDFRAVIGDGEETFWVAGTTYTKAAHFAGTVDLFPDGYYAAILEFSIISPDLGTPVNESGLAVTLPDAQPTTTDPVVSAPQGAWAGRWADVAQGSTRIWLRIDSSDIGTYSVEVTDKLYPFETHVDNLAPGAAPATTYKGDIWTEPPAHPVVVVRPPRNITGLTPVSSGGADGSIKLHVRPGLLDAVDSIGRLALPRADTIVLDANHTLQLYADFAPGHEIRSYRVRYLSTSDSGATRLDVMLVTYDDIR